MGSGSSKSSTHENMFSARKKTQSRHSSAGVHEEKESKKDDNTSMPGKDKPLDVLPKSSNNNNEANVGTTSNESNKNTDESEKEMSSLALENSLQKLDIPPHDCQSILKMVKDNSLLLKHFILGFKCVKFIHDTSSLKYLEMLDLGFFEVEPHHRQIIGDFLGYIRFAQESYIKYKNILKSYNIPAFTDLLELKKMDKDDLQCLFTLRNQWWNFSDCSVVFSDSLAAHGVLQEMNQDIVNITDLDTKKMKYSFTFESAIGVLHNLAKQPNLRQKYREMKTVETLGKFLSLGEDLPKLTMVVLMTLALIIDDDQTHLLFSHEVVFDILLEHTKRAWKLSDHRYDGFSLEELVQGLYGLSKNDQVKKVLVAKGVLILISDMLKNGSDKEKEAAMNLLWELSFDQETKSKIQEDAPLLEIINSFSEQQNRKVARAAQGVLWSIDMMKKRSVEKPSKKKKKRILPNDGKSNQGHIMISYNWGDQKKILEIKDVLKSSGFNVWMDIDNIQGSTLQAMAEAVEGSEVVLVCMSEKYKESTNCRSEAEYAFYLQRPIIPLVMQMDYKPDGWLGILLGTKLFFNFSGKYPFDVKINELIKEIGNRGKSTSGIATEDTDGPVVKESAPLVGKGPSDAASLQPSVTDWLTENNLTQFSCLHCLSSENLKFLKKISSRAPEFYYGLVNDLLLGKIKSDNLDSLMQVTDAIEKIPR